MDIKMIAIDLDDTLLNDDLEITEENLKTIKRAEEQGIIIVLASGRSPFAMESYVKDLGLDLKPGYKISYNGAMIVETHTGEVVFRDPLDASLALEVYEYVASEKMPIQTYHGDTIYVTFENDYTDKDCALTGMKQETVEDFQSFIQESPIKYVIPGEPAVLEVLEWKLKTNFGYKANIFRSKPYFLEVMDKGVDKKEALALLAEKRSIPPANIMAIGDAMNDYQMVKYAGLGVAMKNAHEQIRDIADVIGQKSNNESGVAEIIKTYVLKD